MPFTCTLAGLFFLLISLALPKLMSLGSFALHFMRNFSLSHAIGLGVALLTVYLVGARLLPWLSSKNANRK